MMKWVWVSVTSTPVNLLGRQLLENVIGNSHEEPFCMAWHIVNDEPFQDPHLAAGSWRKVPPRQHAVKSTWIWRWNIAPCCFICCLEDFPTSEKIKDRLFSTWLPSWWDFACHVQDLGKACRMRQRYSQEEERCSIAVCRDSDSGHWA